MDDFDTKAIDSAIEKYKGKKDALLSIMHEIQKKQGVISDQAARYLSQKLAIPVSQIFGAASFYKAFTLDKKGKHHIKVCVGTACYLHNSEKIFERLGRELNIAGEGTSENQEFSLEKVRCMGCCNAGPAVTIDDQAHETASSDNPSTHEIYGDMTHSKAMNIIKKYREEK